MNEALLFSVRETLTRVGVPACGPDGAPASDGYRVKRLVEMYEAALASIAEIDAAISEADGHAPEGPGETGSLVHRIRQLGGLIRAKIGRAHV